MAGAWFFWPAPKAGVAGKKSARAVSNAAHANPPPPAPSTGASGAANASQAGVVKTNRFAYRLANTTKPIGELVNDRKAILLENALIDTGSPLNFSIPPQLQSQGDPGAYIVQARGPINAAFRALLASAGAQIISYIPNDAYLVRVTGGRRERAGRAAAGAVGDSLRAVLQNPVVAARPWRWNNERLPARLRVEPSVCFPVTRRRGRSRSCAN